MVFFLLAIACFSGVFNHQTVTAQQFVNIQQGDKFLLEFRRAHAKGSCISGSFISNGSLGQYSIANIFKEGEIPFLGRFSLVGNNPTAPALKAPVRSLVYAVNPEATQEWRVMNSPPVMAVATPDAFFKQLQVLWPILLQKSDALKIKKLFVDHPESRVFNQWNANYVLLIVSHLSIITVLMSFLVNGSSL